MDELYKKLKDIDTQEFMKKINFGLMVIDESGNILHFCGYENLPTDADKKSLYKELKEDSSFGLIDKIDSLEIMEAPQEIVISYIQNLKEGK